MRLHFGDASLGRIMKLCAFRIAAPVLPHLQAECFSCGCSTQKAGNKVIRRGYFGYWYMVFREAKGHLPALLRRGASLF